MTRTVSSRRTDVIAAPRFPAFLLAWVLSLGASGAAAGTPDRSDPLRSEAMAGVQYALYRDAEPLDLEWAGIRSLASAVRAGGRQDLRAGILSTRTRSAYGSWWGGDREERFHWLDVGSGIAPERPVAWQVERDPAAGPARPLFRRRIGGGEARSWDLGEFGAYGPQWQSYGPLGSGAPGYSIVWRLDSRWRSGFFASHARRAMSGWASGFALELPGGSTGGLARWGGNLAYSLGLLRGGTQAALQVQGGENVGAGDIPWPSAEVRAAFSHLLPRLSIAASLAGSYLGRGYPNFAAAGSAQRTVQAAVAARGVVREAEELRLTAGAAADTSASFLEPGAYWPATREPGADWDATFAAGAGAEAKLWSLGLETRFRAFRSTGFQSWCDEYHPRWIGELALAGEFALTRSLTLRGGAMYRGYQERGRNISAAYEAAVAGLGVTGGVAFERGDFRLSLALRAFSQDGIPPARGCSEVSFPRPRSRATELGGAITATWFR